MSDEPFPERAELDPDGKIVYAGAPPIPGKPPVNPKVIAGVIWGFAAPLLLAVALALVGYFSTDEGRALTGDWPVVLQVAFYALVGAAATGLAGYRKSDARYRAQRQAAGL